MNIKNFEVSGKNEKIKDEIILKLVKFNYNDIRVKSIAGFFDFGSNVPNQDHHHLVFEFSNGDRLKYFYNSIGSNKRIAYENCLITNKSKVFKIARIAIGEIIGISLIDKILYSYCI